MAKVDLGLPRKRASTAKAPTTPTQVSKKGSPKTSPKKSAKTGSDAGAEKVDHGYYPPGMVPNNGKGRQPQAEVDDSVDYNTVKARFENLTKKALLDVKEVDPGFFVDDNARSDLVVHLLESGFQHAEDKFIPELIPKTVAENWGYKPYPKMTDDGPVFNKYDDQPVARTSNAGAVPELWEDSIIRFHHGRYHEVTEGGTTTKIDQKEMIYFKMMDMRPVWSEQPDGETRRLPMVYECKGIPLNWKNKCLIKAMNDRRYQALQRARNAPRWDVREREYMVKLLSEFPNISITEVTERMNYRFQGDVVDSTMFHPHKLHPGRTIEDVRAEYLEHKDKYDAGIIPKASRMNKELGKEEKDLAKALEAIYDSFGPAADDNNIQVNNPAKRTRRSKDQIEKDNNLNYSDDAGEDNMASLPLTPQKKTTAGPRLKLILKPKSQIAKVNNATDPDQFRSIKKLKVVRAPDTTIDSSNSSKKRKAMDDFPSHSMPIPMMKPQKRAKVTGTVPAKKGSNKAKSADNQLLHIADYDPTEVVTAAALGMETASPARLRELAAEFTEVAQLLRTRADMLEADKISTSSGTSTSLDRDGDSEMSDAGDDGENGGGPDDEDDEEIMI